MVSSNKACKWSFCSNILLLYMNTAEISWQRFFQHHPEHHVRLLPTDNFMEDFLVQCSPSPLLCARHLVLRAPPWTMYKSSNLPLVICQLWWDHPQPCLCGLGAWKVSPALFAEAPCLQPPTSLELLRGCSAASCAVPSCFPPASAPTGTGPVLKCPWT